MFFCLPSFVSFLHTSRISAKKEFHRTCSGSGITVHADFEFFLPYNHQRQQQQQQQHNTGNNNSNSSHSSNTGNSNSRVEVHFFEVPCIASLLPFFEILLMNIFLTLRCAAFIIIVGDGVVDVVVVVVVEVVGVVDVVVVVEVVGKK